MVILGGNQRIHRSREHLGQPDPFAVGAFEHRELLVIGREHDGRLGRLGFLQVIDAGGFHHLRV